MNVRIELSALTRVRYIFSLDSIPPEEGGLKERCETPALLPRKSYLPVVRTLVYPLTRYPGAKLQLLCDKLSTCKDQAQNLSSGVAAEVRLLVPVELLLLVLNIMLSREGCTRGRRTLFELETQASERLKAAYRCRKLGHRSGTPLLSVEPLFIDFLLVLIQLQPTATPGEKLDDARCWKYSLSTPERDRAERALAGHTCTKEKRIRLRVQLRTLRAEFGLVWESIRTFVESTKKVHSSHSVPIGKRSKKGHKEGGNGKSGLRYYVRCTAIVRAEERHKDEEMIILPFFTRMHQRTRQETNRIRESREGRQCKVSLNKAWGSLCVYVIKQDKKADVWGKFSLEEILMEAEAVAKHRKGTLISMRASGSALDQIQYCDQPLGRFTAPEAAGGVPIGANGNLSRGERVAPRVHCRGIAGSVPPAGLDRNQPCLRAAHKKQTALCLRPPEYTKDASND
ncbi:hypothetical protein E5676_scaffold84538G00020 [Cucumis melo var. makuwa]|uniref:Uncharacterized protein n=1 Tax=Cucumis melo var. makuwa TaxID=1194695 RepID=A0A5D3D5A2_CUCMM|nr:hypothetical protein E6C27_scaffold44069G00020 [Cucumis melo var. makuwa]TYK18700.1 hypothetical protein E5676_scaffold84538G00020 [Cucumis melo var. makuwa]